jgi:oxygen-independent coproporphyrinogen-3 oxidase
MSDLSLYFHLPFCRRRCRYCSFVTQAGREALIPEYVAALEAELRLRRRSGAVVRTIYFGGGTPSLAGAELIGRLVRAVADEYEIGPGAEITLETNPGTVEMAGFRGFRAAGINRLSLGAQSLADRELEYLGRTHSADRVGEAVEEARRAGFDNISLDFIYGLPGRSPVDWRRMLADITALGAEHLSFYGLSIDAGTPLAEAVAAGRDEPVDPDAAADEYESASDCLERAGYLQYEISNWAAPGRESRHNLVYWQGGEYLGLGAGAHSYADGRRTANSPDPDEYLECLVERRSAGVFEETITPEMGLSETVILGLRLNRGVSAGDIRRRFGIDLFSAYATEIEELRSFGLLEPSGRENLRLTRRGRLLGNEVFLRFLPFSD